MAALLRHPPAVDDECAGGDLERIHDVLLDEQDREPSPVDLAQALRQFLDDAWSKTEGELVDTQDLGIQHERLGQSDQEPVALGRLALAAVADAFQDRVGPALGYVLGGALQRRPDNVLEARQNIGPGCARAVASGPGA